MGAKSLQIAQTSIVESWEYPKAMPMSPTTQEHDCLDARRGMRPRHCRFCRPIGGEWPKPFRAHRIAGER